MSDPSPPQEGKFRVLVIEDDPHIMRLVTATLAKANFDCREAKNGIEGLEQFKLFDPHLVLTDILMPGMDGRQVCANIREFSMVPVIMMTAADTPEAQLAAFKAGADDYLSKPFDPRVLTSRIVAHLRRVYRYDAAIYAAPAQPASPAQQPAQQPAPQQVQTVTPAPAPDAYRVPWMTCTACGYMGPRNKFMEGNGRSPDSLSCPHCEDGQHLRFAKFDTG